jgi:hypothetical protein
MTSETGTGTGFKPAQDQQKEQNEYEMMDALDERQIVAELKGDIIEQYFYEFQQGGRLVVGISWSGIKYVARKMSEQGHPISVEDVKFNPTEKGYLAIATAMDLATKEKRWGASEASRMVTLRSGDEKENPFALQVAMSKAQRNAIRNFIPEVAIQEGYKEWKQRAATGAGSRGSFVAAPPPMTRANLESTPDPISDYCACGHWRSLHIFEASKAHCMTCIREGVTDPRCSLAPIKKS